MTTAATGGTTGGAGSSPERVHVPGVAEALPEGERVLWRGAPRRALIARHLLHVRLVALYFAATAGWWALRTAPALPAGRALSLLALQLLLGGVVLALMQAYAWMTARGTTYLVTSRRVVFRVGAVFPVVVNVPLTLVTSAGVRRFRDGSAQIALTLDPTVRVSWWLLWPHVRPVRLRWPEPLLRALDPAAAAAAAAALRSAATELTPAQVTDVAPVPSPAASSTASARQSARAGRAGTSLAPT